MSNRRAIIKRAKIRRVRPEEIFRVWVSSVGLRRRFSQWSKKKIKFTVDSKFLTGIDFAKPNSDTSVLWLNIPGHDPIQITNAMIEFKAPHP